MSIGALSPNRLLSDEFFEWLDTVPCTATGVIVQTGRGETRVVPRSVAFAEWRSRHPEQRSRRDPGVERRRNQLTLLGALLEKELGALLDKEHRGSSAAGPETLAHAGKSPRPPRPGRV